MAEARWLSWTHAQTDTHTHTHTKRLTEDIETSNNNRDTLWSTWQSAAHYSSLRGLAKKIRTCLRSWHGPPGWPRSKCRKQLRGNGGRDGTVGLAKEFAVAKIKFSASRDKLQRKTCNDAWDMHRIDVGHQVLLHPSTQVHENLYENCCDNCHNNCPENCCENTYSCREKCSEKTTAGKQLQN